MGMLFKIRVTRKIRYSIVGQFQTTFKRLLLCVVICDIFVQHLQPVYAAVKPLDRDAHIIYYKNQAPSESGDFHYEFQTSNGITTKAAGNKFGHSGVVQYISAEGIPITMTYVADADGYHPTGKHIPKLPEQVWATQIGSKRQQRTVDEKTYAKTTVRKIQ
ncbi:PREDICTED: pupal cuticle protein Edg-78E-like [Bactrocera latifrons]|uniref:pupal cuticle protein Edg-78E-like n=1 Tax=Bactrocera latifrons TaxID=174628 RepID=UPI0008DD32A2|nr:PREDICTED: pupal cuticle protein Edg-78E-like [Bactrocera latifrons]